MDMKILIRFRNASLILIFAKDIRGLLKRLGYIKIDKEDTEVIYPPWGCSII